MGDCKLAVSFDSCFMFHSVAITCLLLTGQRGQPEVLLSVEVYTVNTFLLHCMHAVLIFRSHNNLYKPKNIIGIGLKGGITATEDAT